MSSEIVISQDDARRMALRNQLLSGHMYSTNDKEVVLRIINRLGYVQIDTIAVVDRAHHHTIWTRYPEYKPEMLHELQADDKQVFEYWGHAMSYLPMSDYRFYLPRMRAFADPNGKWERDRFAKYGHLMEPTLKRIRDEGPLSSKDFESYQSTQSDSGTHPKPMKAALELLFWRGDIMISERRRFMRFFDLTERVLPDTVDTKFPTDDELGRFLVRRALSVHGVCREEEICEYIHSGSKELISLSLRDLIEEGEVIPVTIESDRYPFNYAFAKSFEKSISEMMNSSQVHFLSPFDNLIIQRDRTKRLFGFDYALECYVPPARRKYGYYVLPVLWRDRLVARMDPKVNRKLSTLMIHNLVFEPGFSEFEEFLPLLADKLNEFTRHHDCAEIELGKITPARIIPPLETLCRQISV